MPAAAKQLNRRAVSFGLQFRKPEDTATPWDIEGVASVETMDQHRSLIPVSAFADGLAEYAKNPLMMALHALSDWSARGEERLPVAKVLKCWIESDQLRFQSKFATTDYAQTILQLYRDDVMRMFSVAFYVLDSRKPTDQELVKYPGIEIVYTRVQLVEISCVPAGSNPGAFVTDVRAAVGAGLNVRADLAPEVQAINAALDGLAKACNALIEKAGGADEAEPGKGNEQDPKQGSKTEGDAQRAVPPEQVVASIMAAFDKVAPKA